MTVVETEIWVLLIDDILPRAVLSREDDSNLRGAQLADINFNQNPSESGAGVHRGGLILPSMECLGIEPNRKAHVGRNDVGGVQERKTILKRSEIPVWWRSPLISEKPTSGCQQPSINPKSGVEENRPQARAECEVLPVDHPNRKRISCLPSPGAPHQREGECGRTYPPWKI